MKTLTKVLALMMLITFAACGGGGGNDKDVLKESDLPENPQTPEEIAKVVYYYYCQVDYDKVDEYYNGSMHRFDDEARDCNIKDLKAEMQDEEGMVSFEDPVNSKKIELGFIKKEGKWLVTSFSSVHSSVEED